MRLLSDFSTLSLSLLLTGALLLSGAYPAPDAPSEATRFVFQSESTVRVEGTSTIHDWTCEASEVIGFVKGEASGGTLESISEAKANVPVQALDCDNGTMNSKMRAALKAEEAPTIQYEVTEARLSQGDSGMQVRVQGRLSMAGATRAVSATVDGERLGAGRYRFTGSVPLNMEEFGIEPPSAMLGTLKTGKDVTVHVNIVAQSS